MAWVTRIVHGSAHIYRTPTGNLLRVAESAERLLYMLTATPGLPRQHMPKRYHVTGLVLL